MSVKPKLALATFFFALTTGFSSASEVVAGEHGLLVFSSEKVENYVQNPKGDLVLTGTLSSGRINHYLTTAGCIYHLEKLLGKVSKLGADLKPILEGDIGPSRDVPYWLDAWNEGVLVLNDNNVLYLDSSLKEVARVPLAPHQSGDITPALNPKVFLAWKEHGYLLANTGELFVIPLDRPSTTEPLMAAFHVENELSIEGQWIDPEDKTLNILGHVSKEDYGSGPDSGLKFGERRVIMKDIVLTLGIEDLNAPPERTVIYEKKEIHLPIGRHVDEDEGQEYRIYERMAPPYRTEGRATGIRIEKISRSTPAYAEIFIEDGKTSLAPRQLVRLKSRGSYSIQEALKDRHGLRWFQAEGTKHYAEPDLQDRVLRLQPESYSSLEDKPALHDTYFTTLNY